jgi:hypothetical protein
MSILRDLPGAVFNDLVNQIRDSLLKGGGQVGGLANSTKRAYEHFVRVKAGITDQGVVKEIMEYVLVDIYARIARKESSNERAQVESIIEFYHKKQPAITHRDSQSVIFQQYSTPAPLTFMAGLFTGVAAAESVFEPTAGNGLFTLGAHPRTVIVNEADDDRRFFLEQRFGKENVFGEDAEKPEVYARHNWYRRFAVVHTNPPFGRMDAKLEYKGYPIKQLEHMMALYALDAMKDDGRAAFVIGGHNRFEGGYFREHKYFFNCLYHYYHVADIINVDGSLYKKQGTQFPTRLVLVAGRKQHPTGHAPKQMDRLERVETDYLAIYERIKTARAWQPGEIVPVPQEPEPLPLAGVEPAPVQIEGAAPRLHKFLEEIQQWPFNDANRNDIAFRVRSLPRGQKEELSAWLMDQMRVNADSSDEKLVWGLFEVFLPSGEVNWTPQEWDQIKKQHNHRDRKAKMDHLLQARVSLDALENQIRADIFELAQQMKEEQMRDAFWNWMSSPEGRQISEGKNYIGFDLLKNDWQQIVGDIVDRKRYPLEAFRAVANKAAELGINRESTVTKVLSECLKETAITPVTQAPVPAHAAVPGLPEVETPVTPATASQPTVTFPTEAELSEAESYVSLDTRRLLQLSYDEYLAQNGIIKSQHQRNWAFLEGEFTKWQHYAGKVCQVELWLKNPDNRVNAQRTKNQKRYLEENLRWFNEFELINQDSIKRLKAKQRGNALQTPQEEPVQVAVPTLPEVETPVTLVTPSLPTVTFTRQQRMDNIVGIYRSIGEEATADMLQERFAKGPAVRENELDRMEKIARDRKGDSHQLPVPVPYEPITEAAFRELIQATVTTSYLDWLGEEFMPSLERARQMYERTQAVFSQAGYNDTSAGTAYNPVVKGLRDSRTQLMRLLNRIGAEAAVQRQKGGDMAPVHKAHAEFVEFLEEMDKALPRALSFLTSPAAPKPPEVLYNTPEREKKLNRIIELYKSIGNETQVVYYRRKLLQKEVSSMEDLDALVRMAEGEVQREQVRRNEQLEPFEFVARTRENYLYSINYGRKTPVDHKVDAFCENCIDRALALEHKFFHLFAQKGYTQKIVLDSHNNDVAQVKSLLSGLTGTLQRIGSQTDMVDKGARHGTPEKQLSALEAFEETLLEGEELLAKMYRKLNGAYVPSSGRSTESYQKELGINEGIYASRKEYGLHRYAETLTFGTRQEKDYLEMQQELGLSEEEAHQMVKGVYEGHLDQARYFAALIERKDVAAVAPRVSDLENKALRNLFGDLTGYVFPKEADPETTLLTLQRWAPEYTPFAGDVRRRQIDEAVTRYATRLNDTREQRDRFKLLAEQNNLTDAQLDQARQQEYDRIEKQGYEFAEQIEKVNFSRVWDRVSVTDNKYSRKLFADLTGIDLGNNQADTRAALQKWNLEAYNAYFEQIRNAARLKAEAEAKAQADEAERRRQAALVPKSADQINDLIRQGNTFYAESNWNGAKDIGTYSKRLGKTTYPQRAHLGKPGENTYYVFETVKEANYIRAALGVPETVKGYRRTDRRFNELLRYFKAGDRGQFNGVFKYAYQAEFTQIYDFFGMEFNEDRAWENEAQLSALWEAFQTHQPEYCTIDSLEGRPKAVNVEKTLSVLSWENPKVGPGVLRIAQRYYDNRYGAVYLIIGLEKHASGTDAKLHVVYEKASLGEKFVSGNEILYLVSKGQHRLMPADQAPAAWPSFSADPAPAPTEPLPDQPGEAPIAAEFYFPARQNAVTLMIASGGLVQFANWAEDVNRYFTLGDRFYNPSGDQDYTITEILPVKGTRDAQVGIQVTDPRTGVLIEKTRVSGNYLTQKMRQEAFIRMELLEAGLHKFTELSPAFAVAYQRVEAQYAVDQRLLRIAHLKRRIKNEGVEASREHQDEVERENRMLEGDLQTLASEESLLSLSNYEGYPQNLEKIRLAVVEAARRRGFAQERAARDAGADADGMRLLLQQLEIALAA